MRLNDFNPYPILRRPLRVLLKKENFLLNLMAVPVGVFSGYVAVALREMIMFFQNLFFFQKFSFDETSILKHHLAGWIIFIPVIGGVFVGMLVFFLALEAKGHGVPEVMEAIILKDGVIRPRVVVVKALASAICIASGGSAGREGPIVQIGSAMGSTIGQWFKLRPGLIKVLVGCGGAASIAATFNTPIAGVIFAFEILLFEFKTRSFVPLVISTVFATVISRLYLGSTPAFPIPSYSFVHPIELVFYLVLGLIAGLLSVGVIKSLYFIESIFDNLKMVNFLKPALGGLVVGIMGFFFPHVFGIGYETVEAALKSKLVLQFLLIMVVLKVIALSFTLGSGGSGGVFAPNMFIGAMLGGAFGVVVNSLFPTITAAPGAYALVGMAAVFSGVSRATLTSIIILFEMTLDYKIILPLMFACVVADGVAWALSKDTIYTKKLSNRGLQIDLDMEVSPLELVVVKDAMADDVMTVEGNDKIQDVWDQIITTGHHGFPVVNRKGRLIGLITEDELRKAIRGGKQGFLVKDVMASKLIVTYPDETLQRAMAKMLFHHTDHLPVVCRDNPKEMLGFLTRTDILEILDKKPKS